MTYLALAVSATAAGLLLAAYLFALVMPFLPMLRA